MTMKKMRISFGGRTAIALAAFLFTVILSVASLDAADQEANSGGGVDYSQNVSENFAK